MGLLERVGTTTRSLAWENEGTTRGGKHGNDRDLRAIAMQAAPHQQPSGARGRVPPLKDRIRLALIALRWGRCKEGDLELLAKNLKAHVGARAPQLRLRYSTRLIFLFPTTEALFSGTPSV